MIGLALEGGGTKGSYQIGAYYAMKDCGIVFDGFCGTSIGSFNSAMLACGKEEELLDGFRKLSAEDQEEMAEILKIKLRKQRNITGEKENSYSLRDTEKNDIDG